MVVMATCENVLDCGIYILRCSKIGNLPLNGAVKTKVLLYLDTFGKLKDVLK